MKILFAVLAVAKICAGGAMPQTVPGDNSHYVEGESRYIWMPDGEGVPHLVDLEKPVDQAQLDKISRVGANNQYWLFTRRNPTSPQILVEGDIASVFGSNYDVTRPVKFIVHGWTGNGNNEMNTMITAAFLEVADINVIVVDWNEAAAAEYPTAVDSVPLVGQSLGNFLIWLMQITDGNWNDVHLVGASLGAHVVGNAGRQARGLPGRITATYASARFTGPPSKVNLAGGGACSTISNQINPNCTEIRLDPAGPLWHGNSNALNISAGSYVEAIHTDGFELGIFMPVGHADFYPNGGVHPQPGCLDIWCSHERAYPLFAASVYFNHLIGRQCGNLIQAMNNQCFGNGFNMGNSILSKRGSGVFGLSTTESWPY